MSKPWLRLWDKMLDSHKAQSLSGESFKGWCNLLCLANRQEKRGSLPDIDGISFALRMKKDRAERLVNELVKAGLIDRDKTQLRMHDWDEWQPEYDSSTVRTRQYRNKIRRGNGAVTSRDVTVTKRDGHGDALACGRAPATELETETEGEGDPPLPPAISLGLGPEFDAVGEFAIQLMGDVSWGRWVTQQGMCGHPAGTIRRALEEASGAGKLSQAYVAAKLRGWASDGGPPKRKGENNGRTSVQQRPEETRSALKRPDFEGMPDTPELRAVKAMWDGPNGVTS